MSEENKTGSLAESMKLVFGDVRAKTKELDAPAVPFVPNRALIRERCLIVVEILRLDGDFAKISGETAVLMRQHIRDLVDKDEAPLSSAEKGMLLQEVFDEVFGFGPLGPLLRDPVVLGICVNGPKNVYVRRDVKFEKTNVFFENDKHLRQTVDKILLPLGLHLDKTCPSVTAHLPNGSRVDVTTSPVSIDGTHLSIECRGTKLFSLGLLVERGVMSLKMAELLKVYAKAKVNIIISGCVGSGRSVLLNAISGHIPASERLITVEEAAELRLVHEHWIRLQAVPADSSGQGAVSMRSLIQIANRLNPDRVVVSECRGAEAYDFLNSLNTGRSGDIATVTARSPSDCLRRLENMVRLGEPGLSPEYIRYLIASTVQVIVQTARQPDGKYKISEIVEMEEFDGTALRLSTMYRLQRRTLDENGVATVSFFDCEEQSRFIE